MTNLLKAKPIAIALAALLGIGVVSGQANDDSADGADLANTGAAAEQIVESVDDEAAEQAAKAEAEQKAAEEAAAQALAEQKAAEEAAAKAKAEQKAAEEAAAKAEEERIAAEQAAKAEEERKAAEAAKAKEQAESSQKNGYTVYITNTGEKYHSNGCRYLKKSKIAIDINDARAQGYDPCKVCNP